MSWIESHQSLSNHRKTIKAARLLKCDKHKFIGHLHELWWWGLDNAADNGELVDIERADLALAASWKGDPETFAVVLLEAGFVDADTSGRRLALHDWWDYAGKLNAKRAKDRERKSPGSRPEFHRNSTGSRTEVAGTVPNLPNQGDLNTHSVPNPREDGGCVSGIDLGVFGDGDAAAPPRLPVIPDRTLPRTESEALYARFEARFREGNSGHFGNKSEAGKVWWETVAKDGREQEALDRLEGYFASSEFADQRKRNVTRISAASWLRQMEDWPRLEPPKPKVKTPVWFQGKAYDPETNQPWPEAVSA